MTSPTWLSRMARMSSISGPGQKLPRASTVRLMEIAVSVMADIPFLDEQRARVVGHEPDDGGGPDGLAHAIDHVLALEPEHVHRHLARDEFDAHLLGDLEELLGAGHAILLGKAAHHPRPHPEEVHLRQLPVADAGAL